MRLLAAALLFAGCGGGAGAPPAEQPVRDTANLKPALDTTYPTPKRGGLIAHGATAGALGAQWTPEAEVCAAPGSLQVLGLGDTVDILLVLRLPTEGRATGTYSVLGPLDSTDAPRTARVGVQRIQFLDLAYRSLRGTVRLDRLDRRAGGRFDVVLEELVSHEEVRYLGAFNAVPVDSAPAPRCRAAPRDSAATAR